MSNIDLCGIDIYGNRLVATTYQDSAAIDAFGRARVSDTLRGLS